MALLSAIMAVAMPAAVASESCYERCVGAGHCCNGNSSSCQKPSCQMGCDIAANSPSLAACNATCYENGGDPKHTVCSFKFKGQNFPMCGGCPQRTLDPKTMKPVILAGDKPWWPPGYDLPDCGSCGAVEQECTLGCRLGFDPALAPKPPMPPLTPPTPTPAAPWPNCGSGLNFSVALGSSMVLQAAPAKAAVFGPVGSTARGVADADVSIEVTVTSSSAAEAPYTVPAVVTAGRWKAFLKPTPDDGKTTYSITAVCKAGCKGTSAISDVAFGDVWFCAGQSNMWLPTKYTYSHNRSFAAIAAGKYDNLRVMAGDSQAQQLAPKVPPTHAWLRAKAAATTPTGSDSDSGPRSTALGDTSAACFYFAQGLTDQHVALGKKPPIIGILNMAIGGSMIEEWITNEVAQKCFGASRVAEGRSHMLWDVNTVPFLDMTVRGWLWYQGENNCGGLHGNSAQSAGYGCMMPALVASWRKAWSVEPGTTDPTAPFGIVGISQGDSEGAKDIASFRFSQQGNYGVLPNKIMPKVFFAHAYDLADPWVGCNSNSSAPGCEGCDTADPLRDCRTPFYMGPELHPRLKQPVGQRLAHHAMAVAYGASHAVTGPTIAGCKLTASRVDPAGGIHAGKLIVTFDAKIMQGAKLAVQSYDKAFPNRSAFAVLNNDTWVAVNIGISASNANAIEVDLSALGGKAPAAIKYAWGDNAGKPNGGDVVCCAAAGQAGKQKECKPFMCPLIATGPTLKNAPFGGLSANPFLAKIVGGKCECPAPQDCSA